MDAWAGYIITEVSPKTVRRYASSLAILKPYLEGLFLDEITKKLIGEIVEARRKTPSPKGIRQLLLVKNATIKRDLTALSSIMAYCEDQEWIDANPVLAWLRPKSRRKTRISERRDPIVLPDHTHIRMVINRAPGLFASLIEAALLTGARQEELSNGKRPQFDHAKKQLTIIGKRNKRRTIDLVDGDDDFGFAVFAALPAAIDGPWLFWHRDEGRHQKDRPVQRYAQVSTNFGRLVRSVARQAQIQAQDFRPFTFHHLRHRAAVDWLKSGRSIYVLQQRLGHTSIQTTEKYLEFLTHDERHKVMFGRVPTGTKTGTDVTVRKLESGAK